MRRNPESSVGNTDSKDSGHPKYPTRFSYKFYPVRSGLSGQLSAVSANLLECSAIPLDPGRSAIRNLRRYASLDLHLNGKLLSLVCDFPRSHSDVQSGGGGKADIRQVNR